MSDERLSNRPHQTPTPGASIELDEEWTAQRLTTLQAVASHLAPPAQPSSAAAEDSTSPVALVIAETLSRPRFNGQDAFVWAALDELDQRAGAPLDAVSEDALERLLRELESDTNPYLAHALRVLLGLSLEARYAVRKPKSVGDAKSRVDGAGSSLDDAGN